jgi:hypothetical protein
MIDADGNEYPLTDRLDGLRDQMQRIAYLTEQPELFNEYIKKFNTKINEHMVGTVTSYVSENPLARRLEFQKGNFSDGHVQDVYDNMTREQRDAARKEARTLSSQTLADESSLDARNERHRDRLTDNLRAELVDADKAGDTEARNEILSRMREVDPELYASKVDGYSKETRKDDLETVARLNRLKLNDDLTQTDIDEAFDKGLITVDTQGKYFNALSGQRDDGFKAAVQYTKNEIGYPDRQIINPSLLQNKAIQEVAQIANRLELARQADPSADLFALAQRLSAEAKQRLNGDRADVLKKAINAAITMLGLPEGATEEQARKALGERIGGKGSEQEKQKYRAALTDINEASQ